MDLVMNYYCHKNNSKHQLHKFNPSFSNVNKIVMLMDGDIIDSAYLVVTIKFDILQDSWFFYEQFRNFFGQRQVKRALCPVTSIDRYSAGDIVERIFLLLLLLFVSSNESIKTTTFIRPSIKYSPGYHRYSLLLNKYIFFTNLLFTSTIHTILRYNSIFTYWIPYYHYLFVFQQLSSFCT